MNRYGNTGTLEAMRELQKRMAEASKSNEDKSAREQLMDMRSLVGDASQLLTRFVDEKQPTELEKQKALLTVVVDNMVSAFVQQMLAGEMGPCLVLLRTPENMQDVRWRLTSLVRDAMGAFKNVADDVARLEKLSETKKEST